MIHAQTAGRGGVAVLLRFRRIAAVLAAFSAVTVLLGSAALPGGTALADDTLRRGDRGSAVVELQKLLKEHDCFDFDQFTGYFGESTEAGVRKFQTLNGLKVDGIAGPDTVALLNQKKDVKLKDPDSLCLGMSGQSVTDIQQRLMDLGLYNEPEPTGYFGPATEEAVKAFQEASGLTSDGIVGKTTRAALNKQYKPTSLIPGMKGDAVTKLQQRLLDLGYYDGTVNGLYDQITMNAVQYYQQLNGLAQDGICGKATYDSVFSKNARTEKEARRDPKPGPAPTPTPAPATPTPAAPASKTPAATPAATPTPVYTDTPDQSAHGQELSQEAVAFAMLQLGKKYVYGTAGPNTFDCTGLTCYVYKHFGITLPRSAADQGNTNYGLKILSRDKLMPGDLVFFRHSDGLIGHAGLYIGNGNFIEAPYTGQVVRISPLSKRTDFAFGRRVFQ